MANILFSVVLQQKPLGNIIVNVLSTIVFHPTGAADGDASATSCATTTTEADAVSSFGKVFTMKIFASE